MKVYNVFGQRRSRVLVGTIKEVREYLASKLKLEEPPKNDIQK